MPDALNPNFTVAEYEAKIELDKRKFSVQSAIAAKAADGGIEVIALSRAIYKFLSGIEDETAG